MGIAENQTSLQNGKKTPVSEKSDTRGAGVRSLRSVDWRQDSGRTKTELSQAENLVVEIAPQNSSGGEKVTVEYDYKRLVDLRIVGAGEEEGREREGKEQMSAIFVKLISR